MDVSLGPVRHRNGAVVAVDRGDLSDKDRRMSQQRSQRTDEVRDVDIAGGDLVKHRREEKEVLTADERDLSRSCPRGARDEAPCRRRQSRRRAPRCEFVPCRSCLGPLDVRLGETFQAMSPREFLRETS